MHGPFPLVRGRFLALQNLSDKVPISVDAQPTPCYLLRSQLLPDAMPICRAAGAISLILIQRLSSLTELVLFGICWYLPE